MKYRIRILDKLAEVPVDQWNALGAAPYPFLRHEFLDALERQHCLGERFGWLPQHLVVELDERLVAAAPLYLKFNSYGEFVFDWSWADAYQRNGMNYYPKLVSAAPYTPATGPKLLLDPTHAEQCRGLLVDAALELAQQHKVSSLHWLFTEAEETDWLIQRGFMRRTGCQFHWENRDYRDFEHFLSRFSSAKRKQVKRERRRVEEAGIEFRLLDGESASEADWRDFHVLYESTFHKRGGTPTLSLPFFLEIAETMPRSVLLVQARHAGEVVAAAFNLVGETTLYGRHWGCREEFHSLHFEACYYQGLQFCIEHGLQRFEPGAQGEHKISRGFLPTATWSTHWLADERFSHAVAHFLDQEHGGMEDYMVELSAHSPYRKES